MPRPKRAKLANPLRKLPDQRALKIQFKRRTLYEVIKQKYSQTD